MKKKKLIFRLLPWVIAAAALACLVIFVGIPLYGPQPVSTLPAPEIVFYEGKTKSMTMENDDLLFEFNPATTYFTVTDKASGQQWHSTPKDAAKDPKAIASNKELLQSTLIVTYTNSSGTTDLNNYKFSIQNGNYEVCQQEDGSIRVDYAIGKIEKIYMIPTAITKVHYDELTAKMKKATVKKVSGNYTLYDPAKLDPSKEAHAEVMALYPEVLNQPLYVLKSGTSEANKKKIEGYFAEANYSQADYDLDQQLVAGKREKNDPVYNVSMIYRLDGRDLIVEVPYEHIRYRADYPITRLTVLPNFGAAGTDVTGSIFIPEGGGALINYNNGKTSQNAYYADLYGWNYSTIRDQLVNETRNTFPVFGMTRDNGSFICILEGASSYAGIQADISGRYTSYNTASAKYNVLHADKYNVSAKTAELVYMFEKEIPDDTIVQRYRFVTGNNYVDMANAYGDYLRAAHPELANAVASKEVPIAVEMVGAIDKTVVKLGLPIDSVVPTTTFVQAADMMLDLKAMNLKNLQIRMTGWANGGVNQKVLTSVKPVKELGSQYVMTKLIESAKKMGVALYFDGISCFAYDSGLTNGFMPFNDAARYTTREHVTIQPYDVVHYQQADWLDPFYLVKPSYAKKAQQNLIAYLQDVGAAGVAFRDIGYLLSGDYNPKDTVTREQVKAQNIETLKEAQAAGQRIMIRMGNDYALPYADIITDMDLDGTRYSITDQSIPFYQIALHGMKDYTGEALNMVGDFQDELLRCAEYGAGLNFTFMAEDTKVLQDTTHSAYFSTYFDKWHEDVAQIASKYQQDMEGLNQQRIVDHQQLTDSLTVTGYEDGTKVYVNYGKQDAQHEGVTIPAAGYHVERGN